MGTYASKVAYAHRNYGGNSRAERDPEAEVRLRDYLSFKHEITVPQNPVVLDCQDTNVRDWRWLAAMSEARIQQNFVTQQTKVSDRIAQDLGMSFDVQKFACFVPRTVLEAVAEKRIRQGDDFSIGIDKFSGTVVFVDASGFTALTEALDKHPNGAEKLGDCINNFFSPLIQIVNYWGGDIIKFSGDAVTVIWPSDDAEDGDVRKSHFSSAKKFSVSATNSVLYALQCCIDLHTNLNDYPTPVEGRYFDLHIGVGFGKVQILQVGGILDRWEYVVAGDAMVQISKAEPLATNKETVVSPEVLELVGSKILWEPRELEGQTFGKLLGLAPRFIGIPSPPPLEKIPLSDDDVDLLKRFIPPAVFKRLASGYNVFLNELREISVIFLNLNTEVTASGGLHEANQLMQICQKAAYVFEGSVNKFLVDDKGVLLLIMFGIPPVHHVDDPIRAIFCALRVKDELEKRNSSPKIGVTTGNVWVGTVGCEIRKEYTAMGDTVNLAARLMAKADWGDIICDVDTKQKSEKVMEYRALAPVKLKGKSGRIAIFSPTAAARGGRLGGLRPELELSEGTIRSVLAVVLFEGDGYEFQCRGRRGSIESDRRSPVVGLDAPPLDLPKTSTPLLPWEYVEPWSPCLRSLVETGGVICIKGREGQGTAELADYIRRVTADRLERTVFYCGNMPDSTNINIGNVPFLPWRKLLNEVLQQWRKIRRRRECRSRVQAERDETTLGMLKELTHPIFHWRLSEIRDLIDNLILPEDIPRPLTKELNIHQTAHRTVRTGSRPLKSEGGRSSHDVSQATSRDGADAFITSSVAPLQGLGLRSRPKRTAVNTNAEADWAEVRDKRTTHFEPAAEFIKEMGSRNSKEADFDPDFLQSSTSFAPIVASVVNGYSLHEPTVVILHVRQGTCLFASMEIESWEVARMIGQVAMQRRKRKMEHDMHQIKEWRRLHSRKCDWCKGLREPYKDLTGRTVVPRHTRSCRPRPTGSFPPLLFVLVSSETFDNVKDQYRIIEWSRQCGGYIPISNLSALATASYAAHILQVPRSALPGELVEFVHRVSSGVPEYIKLTLDKLTAYHAITADSRTLAGVGHRVLDSSFAPKTTFHLTGAAEFPSDARTSDEDTEWCSEESSSDDSFARPIQSADEWQDLPSAPSERVLREDPFDRNWFPPGRGGSQESPRNASYDTPLSDLLGTLELDGVSAIYDSLPVGHDSLTVRKPKTKGVGFNQRIIHVHHWQQNNIRSIIPVDVASNLLQLPNGVVVARTGLVNATDRGVFRRFYNECIRPKQVTTKPASPRHLDIGTKLLSEKQQQMTLHTRAYAHPWLIPVKNLSWLRQPQEEVGQDTDPRFQQDGTLLLERPDAPFPPELPIDKFIFVRDRRILYGKKVMDNLHTINFNVFEKLSPAQRYEAVARAIGVVGPPQTSLKGIRDARKPRTLPTIMDEIDFDAFVPPGPQEYDAASKYPFDTEDAKRRARWHAGKKKSRRRVWSGGTDLQKVVKVEVAKELKRIPFVKELKAAALDLMELLQPDEQLAAKVASVFPVPFTYYEIQALFPRLLTATRFNAMLANLMSKSMLQPCETPEMPQSLLDDFERLESEEREVLQINHVKEIRYWLHTRAGDHRDGLEINERESVDRAGLRSLLEFSQQLSSPAAGEEQSWPLLREMTRPDGQISVPASSQQLGRLVSREEEAIKQEPTVKVVPGDESQTRARRDSTRLPNGIRLPASRAIWTRKAPRPEDPEHLRWALDSEGFVIFYRFSSIAFQHFVCELLLSDERRFLSHIAKKVLALRRTHSPFFMMKQIIARQSLMDTHKEATAAPMAVDPHTEMIQKVAPRRGKLECLFCFFISACDLYFNVFTVMHEPLNEAKHNPRRALDLPKSLTSVHP